MDILQKFKDTAWSVVPIMIIVMVLGLTVAPLGRFYLMRFAVGGVLLILGLTLFLLGVDASILPLGSQCGAALTGRRDIRLLLGAAFVIGVFVTAAEPDIQVLSHQVRGIFSSVNAIILTVGIAVGVGLFIALGLLRTVMGWGLKILILAFYAVILVLAFRGPKSFIGIAFDAGGATTGPMTVPFIMALGVGVSAVRANSRGGGDSRANRFGLTGMASIGPILAVLVYGMILSQKGALKQITDESAMSSAILNIEGLSAFGHVLPAVARDAAVSLAPVVVLFLVFQFTLLHLPPFQIKRMAVGFLYSYFGLVIFLTGVNGGFMTAGRLLGEMMGVRAGDDIISLILIVMTGALIGTVVVCAEPAVWVLTDQVEQLTGGTIKRRHLLVFLAVGSAFACAVAMLRAVKGFPITRILVPGYILALVLMIFCPLLFTGIAFDSGGVASGPISSTFVLSFTLGASQAAGNGGDAFGVIALIAMTPLVAVQVMGIVWGIKQSGNVLHSNYKGMFGQMMAAGNSTTGDSTLADSQSVNSTQGDDTQGGAR